jgi:hypothetical protein
MRQERNEEKKKIWIWKESEHGKNKNSLKNFTFFPSTL